VGERGGGVGSRWLRGPEEEVGRRVSGPSWASGDKRAGREKGRERGWEGFLLVFLNLFKLTFQTFEIELFSKHSKIFRTFLKAFKTSHKQIIKPCIQIMMHKHLLLLNY
jgi:hypothetical protein